MNKRVYQLFKDAHEKTLASTCIELFETVEQTAANAVYIGRAEEQINNKLGHLAKSQDFNQHVIQQLIHSPKFTATVTRLMKQLANIAVTRKSNKTTIFGQSQNTPSIRRPNYRDAAVPSVYHPQAMVLQYSNRSQRRLIGHQGGTENMSTKIHYVKGSRGRPHTSIVHTIMALDKT